MATTADVSKIVSYAVLSDVSENASKIVSYAALSGISANASKIVSYAVLSSISDNPPFAGGARVAKGLLVSWLPPQPRSLSAINLDPPISGPTPEPPPVTGGAAVPEAVLISWLPPQPASQLWLAPLRPNLTLSPPQDPPFAGGAAVPAAVLVSWLPPQPQPQPSSTINLDPPISGPPPQDPPIMGGAAVPEAVLISWLPLPPQPPHTPLLVPPSGTEAFTLPAGPRSALQAVLDSWLAPPWQILSRPTFTPAAPQNPPINGGAGIPEAILISWLAAPPAPPQKPLLTPPSGPDNPPFMGGARAPEAVLISWLPLPPRPPSAPLLDPRDNIAALVTARSSLRSGFDLQPVTRPVDNPDPLWVAVELDLFDSIAPQNPDGTTTVRLSNRGPLTRTVNGVLYQYEPRLQVPILLGTTLTIFSGGGSGVSNADFSMFQQPLRGQPNGGPISWAMDPDFANYLNFAQFRWLGRTFRVYEGRTTTDVGVDVDGSNLTLVYTGHIAGLTYDLDSTSGQVATIQTTDPSSDLNKTLVDDLYPLTFPIVTLQGKTKQELRGRALSIEPVLEDQANLIYRVTRVAPGVIELDDVTELRVGGVPWERVAASPAQGQWAADLASGTVQLGSVTGGAEVRVDAQAVGWETLDTAQLVTNICTEKSVPVDPAYMAQLRLDWPGLTHYFTAAGEGKNTLDAIDEITLANLCWWCFGPDGAVIAGFVDGPNELLSDFVLFASNPQIPLDIHVLPSGAAVTDPVPKELASNSLTQLLPPAWRVRMGYAKRWSPGSQFLGGIRDEEQAFWRAPELVLDYNAGVLIPAVGELIRQQEPRAQDLYISTLAWRDAEAQTLRTHLVQRITGNLDREIYNVTAWMPAEQIKLFQTVTKYWRDDNAHTEAIYSGAYRVTSAILSIGGGPQQMELWGGIATTAYNTPRP